MFRSVLIVEDNIVVGRMLKCLCESQGFTPLVAEDVETAWTIFQQNLDSIEIVILDGFLLGGVVSIQLVHWIRQEYGGLMIAHSADEWLQLELLKAGCNVRADKGAAGLFTILDDYAGSYQRCA